MQDGSSPRFCGDEIPTCTILEDFDSNQYPVSILRSLDHHKVSAGLVDLSLGIASFTNILNSRYDGNKLDPLDYSESVVSFLYNLLRFAPLGGPRPNNPLENLVHLTLLAFMTTLLPEYGHNHSMRNLLASHLRLAHDDFPNTDGRNREITLWALFISRVSVLGRGEDRWLLPSLAETCRRLNLHAWPDVCQILCEFAWISPIHEKAGKVLWVAVERQNNLPACRENS